MSSKRRACVNDPDIFCYILGSFVPSVQRQNITPFVKNVYFGIRLGDQDKAWAPHRVCRNFVLSLRQWSPGKQKSLAFGISVVWREPKRHGKEFTFANVLLVGTMLKISLKFNNLYCLVPCDRFLMGQVFQLHCLQECWKQLKILSVRSLGLIAS